VAILTEQLKKGHPSWLPLSTFHEGNGVADHDKSVPCTQNEQVQTLGSGHEANVANGVAASKRRNDNVTLLHPDSCLSKRQIGLSASTSLNDIRVEGAAYLWWR
jgi:hypothetical protein